MVAVVTVLGRGIWGYMYSSEEEVVNYLATMIPIVAASNFLDTIQCVFSGKFLSNLNAWGKESEILMSLTAIA